MGKAWCAGAILPSMQTSGSKPCSCPSFKLREVASMYFTMIAVFLVILVVALQSSAPRGSDFPYKVPLDPQGLLELSWNISYPKQAVHFQLLVRDLKFGLLFGMSDRGEFENADLAVLWNDGHNSYFGVSCCVFAHCFGAASLQVNLACGLEAGLVQGMAHAGPLLLLGWKRSQRGWGFLCQRDPQIRYTLWAWHRIFNLKNKYSNTSARQSGTRAWVSLLCLG